METPKNNEALPKAEASEEKADEKNKRKKRIIIRLIIILLLLLGLYFLFRIFLAPKPTDYGETINVLEPVKSVETSDQTATTTTLTAKRAQAIASSENFDALQINLEGSGTNIFDFGETEILAISNVASELYSTKQGEKTEIKAIISLQTNKRSYVEAEYQKSGEKEKKAIKDTYLGFNHVLVTPALDPDSVYKYSLSATDLDQNKIYSEQYVFYTGAGAISLVDILGNAVQKVFGWAMGK